MERLLRFFSIFIIIICAFAVAPCPARQKVAAAGRLSKYVDPQSYAYMYPYLSNQMRTELNPGTTVSMANNPIDVVVKTGPMAAPRRVVPRSQKTTNTRTARAATNTTTATATQPAQARRVVARQTANTARAATNTSAVGARAATKPITRTATATGTVATATEGVSYNRCIADYIQCMDGYCARESAAYNRCYCSAKLAQIDAQYQNQISDLIKEIIKIQSGVGNNWSAEEMNEYWMQAIGQYVGTNSWTDMENALNIEWPTAEERVRGQQVFVTGHGYCAQHLRACAPMASNMRDVYRSRIARDCGTYESTLMKIKNAAETFIENYRE